VRHGFDKNKTINYTTNIYSS